jgi:hypothetical protein
MHHAHDAASGVIGVLCKDSEMPIVGEFFELFKVPWERHVPGARYSAVICSDIEAWEKERSHQGPFIVFSSSLGAADSRLGIRELRRQSGAFLAAGDSTLPLYGSVSVLSVDGDHGAVRPLATTSGQPGVAGIRREAGDSVVLRFGYDLFEEVRFLLTEGQPPENAPIPTLDLHIDLLRRWLVEEGVTLIEVPPTPHGYRFIACLTHDVDFAAIRHHVLDRAFFGFLYRASVGSLARLLKGDLTLRELARNCLAIASLPLVYAGLMKDFWNPFDRYVEIEKGHSSTFFIIPFKNVDGQEVRTTGKARRRTKYDCDDVESDLRRLQENGKEVAVHGIDAWRDATQGARELERLRRITRQQRPGVRIHWLLFNPSSWSMLETAGYRYDSTFGYNDAVGFRAGTLRAYVPPGAQSIFELPLHIQDTALFYSRRLNLTRIEAQRRCRQVIDHARRLGGALTILWHDRSAAPERQWEWLYQSLLEDFRADDVWITSARKAVKWFEARRSVRFDRVDVPGEHASVQVSVRENAEPPLQVRISPGAREESPTSHELHGDCAVVVTFKKR